MKCYGCLLLWWTVSVSIDCDMFHSCLFFYDLSFAMSSKKARMPLSCRIYSRRWPSVNNDIGQSYPQLAKNVPVFEVSCGKPKVSDPEMALLISFHCVTVVSQPSQIGVEGFETCVGI